jgi:WD40 repeat protein
LRVLPGSVVKVVFSRDGKRVAALSWDWWAGVWDRDTGRLLRIFAVPRGESADNADLTLSPDGLRLAVSAGNTATLWDVETGQAQKWALPWAMTEALAFPASDRLMLFRAEVRDGSRSPNSKAPAAEFPRVCVLRNLLGPRPTEPVEVIADFDQSVKEIEASPDGACFVIDGVGRLDGADHRRLVRVYKYDGSVLTELSTQMSPINASTQFAFDPTGTLLAYRTANGLESRDSLLKMPSGRFLRTAPIRLVFGVAQEARLWAGAILTDGRINLLDSTGNTLVEQFLDSKSSLSLLFSPDHDGRYLLWGNPSGTVTVADLVEIRGRLTGIGLGW